MEKTKSPKDFNSINAGGSSGTDLGAALNKNKVVGGSSSSTGGSGGGSNVSTEHEGRRSAEDSSNAPSNKDGPSSTEKKFIKSSTGGSSTGSGGNSGSRNSSGSGAGAPDVGKEDMELTRKHLFFSSFETGFDGPKFDLTKYQIPKKSSNTNTSGGSGSGDGGGSGNNIISGLTGSGSGSGSGNNENSPKTNTASPSPSSGTNKSNNAFPSNLPVKETSLDKLPNVSTTVSDSSLPASSDRGENPPTVNEASFAGILNKDKTETLASAILSQSASGF
jgi:collagen type III alpha